MKPKLRLMNRNCNFWIRVAQFGFKDYQVVCKGEYEAYDRQFDNLSEATKYALELSQKDAKFFEDEKYYGGCNEN